MLGLKCLVKLIVSLYHAPFRSIMRTQLMLVSVELFDSGQRAFVYSLPSLKKVSEKNLR